MYPNSFTWHDTKVYMLMIFNLTEKPCVLNKLQVDSSLKWRSSLTFNSVGGYSEKVHSAYPMVDQRILMVATTIGSSIYVVPLLMYAVESIAPTLADSRGGTLLTLIGDGFIKTKP